MSIFVLSSLAILAPVVAGTPAAPLVDPACITMNTEHLPLKTRKSPLDSISFTVGGKTVKVCYGRPSRRGRTMLGGESVPYGKLWRTGANEPTMIHTTGPLAIAGIAVPAGSYSLYTVPGASEWELIVNRSITQWGEESNYTEAVRKQEVGRTKIKPEPLNPAVESLTLRPDPSSTDAKALLLEWENTRLRIPLSPGR
jgi:hypothetical protein